MAKKKPVPQTAEMKAARAAQQQSAILGIQQQVARTRSISRGAYGGRSLRSSGNIDAQYAIGKYKDDAGAMERLFGGGTVPIYTPFVPPAATSKPAPKRKPKTVKPPPKPPKTGKSPPRNPPPKTGKSPPKNPPSPPPGTGTGTTKPKPKPKPPYNPRSTYPI